jgi:ligand-binding sensor domain-containing protein
MHEWGGNAGGVVRFDGVNWTVYNQENSGLPNDDVQDIAIDSQGKIWIATSGTIYDNTGGVAMFNGMNWTVYTQENSGLPDNGVTALDFDIEGNLWVATASGGIARFDGMTWRVYNAVTSMIPFDYVGDVAIDDNMHVWVVGSSKRDRLSGVGKFDGKNWIIHHEEEDIGLPSRHLIEGLVIDGNDNVWIGTDGNYEGSLAKYDGLKWTIYNNTTTGFPGNGVTRVAIDNNRNKWLVTGYVLTNFDGVAWDKKWQRSTIEPNPLLRSSIIDIAFDNYGYTWVALHQGLYKIKMGEPIEAIRKDLLWNEALAIDSRDRIWIGTTKGLTMFDGENWQTYDENNSDLPHNHVTAIAVDTKGVKWIGTKGGLARFDGRNWKVYTKENGLPDSVVTATVIDAKNNIWIGTKNGAANLDGANWIVYTKENSGLPHNSVRTLAIEDKDVIWIGTDDGLAKFDGADWTVYNMGNSRLSVNSVNGIAIEGNGNKWLATDGGGLAVYREGGIAGRLQYSWEYSLELSKQLNKAE